MSELNDNIRFTIDDAPVVTVPLVQNFTATNAAPTAKYVGDALAAKLDTADVMEHVTITLDGVQSDNQGVLLVSAEDIPVTDGTVINPQTGAGSIKAALDTLDAKSAAEISYTALGSQTVKAKVDGIAADVSAIEAAMNGDAIPFAEGGTDSIRDAVNAVAEHQFADMIPMSGSDTTTIAGKISSLDATTLNYASGTSIKSKIDAVAGDLSALSGNVLKLSDQTLSSDQQASVRSRIGLGGAALYSVAADLTTATAGVSVLDAKCGKDLKDAADILAATVGGISTNMARIFRAETYGFSYDDLSSGSNKSYTQADVGMVPIEGYTPIGVMSIVTGYANVAVTRFSLTSSSYLFTIRNNASSAQSSENGSITVLWALTACVAPAS